MKPKVIVSLLIGMLFYINGFNQLWALFFSAKSLEVTRGNGWWGFSMPVLDNISQWLYFISCLGFVGLLCASIAGFKICRKLQISRYNATVAFLLACIINKSIMSYFLFFEYRSSLFKHVSMHVLFITNFFLAILTGTVFLILPLYFRFFKYANPGCTA